MKFLGEIVSDTPEGNKGHVVLEGCASFSSPPSQRAVAPAQPVSPGRRGRWDERIEAHGVWHHVGGVELGSER